MDEKEIRVFDDNQPHLGLEPAIRTLMDRRDVHVVYHSKANGGIFTIPLILLIEVYEDRMG